MSTSLIAVFVPILLMGGIVGRLFREFAIALLSGNRTISGGLLTTTPMMCAKFPEARAGGRHNRLLSTLASGLSTGRATGLRVVCVGSESPAAVLALTLGHHCTQPFTSIYRCPRGFFPSAGYRTHERGAFSPIDVSFNSAMKLAQYYRLSEIVSADPMWIHVSAYTGGISARSDTFRAHVHYS